MDNQPIKIGLPRAMLYYRYRVLWRTFFAELDMETVVSAPTDREILEQGTALAIDEACLSLKIYLGHAAALMGKCDYILAPRVSSLGRHRSFCTRFESMPDLVRNVFRASGQNLLTYEVDEGMQRKDEESAFLEMGRSLGCPAKAVKRAYRLAKKADAAAWKERVQKHEQRYKTEGMKVLIAAHSYVAEDPYMGRPVTDYLKQAGVIPVRADIVDRDAALKHSRELSPTCKWEISREILGGIVQHKDDVNGIILLSAFPCGPDAMVNELITRRVEGVPILNLVLDSQSGTAGVETRLESFIDIIRFKEGTL
jgi:predicted nucleotide-binding protein (sugar kinase/HSP70/actin superfamily)